MHFAILQIYEAFFIRNESTIQIEENSIKNDYRTLTGIWNSCKKFSLKLTR